MNNYILFSTIFCSFIALFAFLFFSSKSYNLKHNERFSIKNIFPCELNENGYFKDNLVTNIILIVVDIFISFFLVYFSIFIKQGSLVFSSVVGLLGITAFTMLNFSTFISLKYHITLSSLLMAFAFMMPIGSIVASIRFLKVSENKGVCLAIIVLSSLVALFNFLLLINPKLNNWAKMDEKDQNGTKVYKRPKISFLALSEWLSFFSIFISAFILILFNFS